MAAPPPRYRLHFGEDIQEIVVATNLPPGKCLGFKTPLQASLAELGNDVQIRFSFKLVALRCGIQGSWRSQTFLPAPAEKRQRKSEWYFVQFE